MKIPDFINGYIKGFNDGKSDILKEVADIYKNSKYPEYLEEDLYEYLKKRGIKI